MAEIMSPHPETDLVVPMRMDQFTEEFLGGVALAKTGDGDGFFAMQFEAQVPDEESTIFKICTSMKEAKRREAESIVSVGQPWVDLMTRIGNRDYLDGLPLFSSDQRTERKIIQVRTESWLQMLRDEDMLIEAKAHIPDRGYVPWLRQAGSFHLLQRILSNRHLKVAYTDIAGNVNAWLLTANMTDSDFRNPEKTVNLV